MLKAKTSYSHSYAKNKHITVTFLFILSSKYNTNFYYNSVKIFGPNSYWSFSWSKSCPVYVLCPVSFLIFGVRKVMSGVYKSKSVAGMEGRVRVKWTLSGEDGEGDGANGEGGGADDGEGEGGNGDA